MKRLQRLSKNVRKKFAIRFMCLPNIGQAVFFLTNSNGKKKKKGTKSGNPSGRSAWCNPCSYDVHWIHHKASQPAAGWRCTDINSRKNWGGLNRRIPRALRYWFIVLRLWAGKNLGFAFPIIFVACKSRGCWAWFPCLRGSAALQC